MNKQTNHRHVTRVGFEPTTVAILEQCVLAVSLSPTQIELLSVLIVFFSIQVNSIQFNSIQMIGHSMEENVIDWQAKKYNSDLTRWMGLVYGQETWRKRKRVSFNCIV